MLSEVRPLSAGGTQEAVRLLRDANIAANSSKKLLHRVRSKLQTPKREVIVSTIINYVDCDDSRSLGVLQALLKTLESQASVERCQSVRRRLLAIAARHGHTEILTHLLVTGADVGHSHGEALQDAVLFGHIPCVEALLHKAPSTDALQRALLTTDFIELDQAREIIRLLLKFKLPRPVLDYLRFKMYAGPPDDFDSEILAMLIAAKNRSSLQSGIATDNLFDLPIYFEVQRQVRNFLLYYTAASYSPEVSTTSIQVVELRRPKRNIFGDETIKSPEHLIIKLLERYIKGCSTSDGVESQWPISTVDLLLDRLPVGAEELPEYARCVFLAANFQQPTVFTRLLYHRTLSITVLRSLSHHVIVRNVEILIALLDLLNVYQLSHEIHLEIVEPLFLDACEAQLIPQAVQICSRSRVPISISTVIEHLKVAITHDENIQHISELFKTAKVKQSDLDILWEHIFIAANFPTNAVRMLLQAGYNSPIVAKSFLRCVSLNENISNLSMMVDEWRIPKTLDFRNNFNYRTRKPTPDEQPAVIDSDHQYFPTLAAALQIGIERQRLELCQLLLEKGASSILAETSLLQRAVFCGTMHLSLDQDKVLDLVLNTEMKRAGYQSVLDFALLQAVKSFRCQVVSELVNQGASTLAYGYECWHEAFRHVGSEALLRSLLTTVRGGVELSQNFKAIFTSFTSDPEVQMSLSSQVHQAGFIDSEFYLWMFQTACQRNKISIQSLEQLIAYGAFEQQALDQCLEQCWRYGNLPAFQALIEKGVSQGAAESLFQSILQDCEASTTVLCSVDGDPLGKPRAEAVFVVMTLLLRMGMPENYLNTALCCVALLSDEPAALRIPILMTLLEKGARFSEDDGLALLHCFFVNDQKLIHKVNACNPPTIARQAALLFVLDFPSGMGEPAPSHRFHALTKLLYPPPSTTKITLTKRNIMGITGMFLSPNSNTPTILIHHFYRWLRNQSLTWICGRRRCSALEKKLDSIVEGLVNTKEMDMLHIERITAVLYWVRSATGSTITSVPSFSFFWISPESLSRYVIAFSKAGAVPIVRALLEAGASPNACDANGKSALSCAATKNKPDVVRFLMKEGAHPNDGSLHEAICHQNQEVIQILLDSGHDRGYVSTLHDNMTPLLAFVQFDHTKSDIHLFPETMNKLMTDMTITLETCLNVKSAIEAALSNRYAFKLILALLPWLRSFFDAETPTLQEPISRGPERYSLLSLVDLWQYSPLTRSERNSLVLSLQGIGFEEMFYTTEGDQPANAVNIPDALLAKEDARKRRSAFLTKECCIHGERPEKESEIHAALASTCGHSWKNDIVCTDCLRQYLETRMFPHDDSAIKYKFPSTKIPCWAPKCPTTELPYNVLQQISDPEIFHRYDLALCQALLREGKSMVKCATSDCPGAHWYEDSDDKDNLKIFFCEICFQNTCTECNDLYEKHDNRPCPAGEEARKSERIKEEEKLSEEALKLEKRCPKCNLMYQKYHGCDHIVCGKNMYDNKVDKGCRFEFCNICFGAWPGGHTRTCAYRH